MLTVALPNMIEMLKATAPGVGSNKILPSLSCIGIKGGVGMTWNTTFGTIFNNAPEGLEATVEHKKLLDLLQTYDGDAVQVAVENQKFHIKGSTGSAVSLPCLPLDDFPFFDIDLKAFKPLEDEHFIDALKICLLSTTPTSTGNGNPVFWGIEFGGNYLFSTDGQRASYYTVKTPLKGVVVPRTLMETIAKMGSPEAMYAKDRFVFFKYDKVILYGLVLQDKYPPTYVAKLKEACATEGVPLPAGAKMFGRRAAAVDVQHFKYDQKKKWFRTEATTGSVEEPLDLGLADFAMSTAHFTDICATATKIGLFDVGKDKAPFIAFLCDLPGVHTIAQWIS